MQSAQHAQTRETPHDRDDERVPVDDDRMILSVRAADEVPRERFRVQRERWSG